MSDIRRGEIRAYEPVLARPGQSRFRLIVSPDAFNQSAAPIVLARVSKDLVAVPLFPQVPSFSIFGLV